MTRLISLAALLALAVAPLAAQDKAKPDDKPPEPALQKQYAELQKEFNAAMRKKLEAAKDDAEREAVFQNLSVVGAPFADKAVKLAQDNVKDPAALGPLTFALIVGRSEKAADLVVDSFQDHKDLPAVCLELAANAPDNPAIESLLKKLSEKATDRKVKGAALFAVATILLSQSDGALDLKKSEALVSEAEKNANAVSKEYADLDGPGEKLGEAAKKILVQIKKFAVGRAAPEVVSRDLDGKEVKLSAQKGKVVVLDIWATWCPPCKAMIPHERKMAERLKDKPFQLISISADEEVETLKKFLEGERMPWVHWFEGQRKGGILNDWAVHAFPTIYVLDTKGVIRYKQIGGGTSNLEKAVDMLVKETEKK